MDSSSKLGAWERDIIVSSREDGKVPPLLNFLISVYQWVIICIIESYLFIEKLLQKFASLAQLSPSVGIVAVGL